MRYWLWGAVHKRPCLPLPAVGKMCLVLPLLYISMNGCVVALDERHQLKLQ